MRNVWIFSLLWPLVGVADPHVHPDDLTEIHDALEALRHHGIENRARIERLEGFHELDPDPPPDPCPIPPCDPPDPGEFDPVAAHADLVNQAEGFFALAGGDGGAGGQVVYVDTLANGGPGSLRAALTAQGARIVLFEDGLSGVIQLTEAIEPTSDKTLWGRHRDGAGADIQVSARNKKAAFMIWKGARDVIIANIKGDAIHRPGEKAPDFIAVQNPGALVWVHHLSCIGGGNMDGCVDIHGDNVTVSWSRVTDWKNVSLIYPAPDGAMPVNVTFHHNLMRRSAGRHPKLDKSARVTVHAYNNWLDDFGYDGMWRAAGTLHAEKNVYIGGDEGDAIKGRWSGGGNVFLDGAYATQPAQGSWVAPYSYTAETVRGDDGAALRERLERRAGWRADF